MVFISKRYFRQNISSILGIIMSDRIVWGESSQNFGEEITWKISTPELLSGLSIPIEFTALKPLGGLYKSLVPLRKYGN
jgi:hypothetical protein